MSVDYSSSLAFGFFLSNSELARTFTQKVEEVFHHEHRYDEMTGERRTIKVIDNEPGDRVIFDGVDLTDDPIQLVEIMVGKLSEKLGFDVVYWSGGNWYSGEMCFVVGPNIQTDDDGSLDPRNVSTLLIEQARTLGEELEMLGLDPGKCRIFSLDLIT